MNIDVIVLIKENKIIGIFQQDTDVINFVENTLDLNTKHMDNEEMFSKINEYVDGIQNIELEVK